MLQIKSYKKKDGQTYYKFQTYLGIDDSGKTVRAARQGFASKAEARKEAMRLKTAFQEDSYKKPTYETFEEVFKLWYETRYIHEVRESTAVKTLELFNNHILKDLGRLRITAITPKKCEIAVAKWAKVQSKARAMKNYSSRVFDYAITSLGLMTYNPMDRVHVPKRKNSPKREINFYTKEELKVFLDCTKREINAMWHPFFRLLAFSGARRGEAMALQWKNVNFKDNTIVIEQTLAMGVNNRLLIQPPKTTAGVRMISLDAITMSILKEWRTRQRLDYLKLGYNTNTPEQYVFTNQSNEFIQLSKVTKTINHIIEKNNLKRITTHQLRHTHASILFEAGTSIKAVQDRLGHSNYQVTMDLYTHMTEKAKENVADIFAQHVNF